MTAMIDTYGAALDQIEHVRKQHGIDIDGRKYSMVKDRIEVFRNFFGFEYGIETKVDYSGGFSRGSMIVASAKIVDLNNGHVVASGHAMEWVGNGDIGTTAPIEACETSAIGRALACFGLHGGEYASANEMQAVPRKRDAGQSVINAPVPETVPLRSQPKPPSMPDGYFVPDEQSPWDDPGQIYQGIMDTLGLIETVPMLGKYWSALEMVKTRWEAENPEWWAELKDNFTARSNEIGRK